MPVHFKQQPMHSESLA